MIFLDKEADGREVALVQNHYTDEATGEHTQEILWARRSGGWTLAVGKRERVAGEEVFIDYTPQIIHSNVLIALSQESEEVNAFKRRASNLTDAESVLSDLMLDLPSS